VLGSQFSATLCELNCPPLPANAIDTPAALLATVTDPATLPVADGANITFNTAVCPGVTVVLAPAPLAVNPAPVTTTLEIVTFAFPVFVSVTPSELLLPTSTLPKFRLLVLALSVVVDAMPLPLVAIASGVLGALLTSEIEPVAFPADVGANTTLNVAFWPAAMLIGNARPEVLKPAPVTFALEIVRLALPPFCNVIVCELLEPIATAGKLALVGIAASCGCSAMPLPLVTIASGVLGALLTSEIEPVTFPADVGANTTLNVALWPAAMLIGNARPEVLKPAPVTFALEIVRLALPPFCNVIVCELLEPIATAGKLALVGVAASCGCGVFVGGATGAGLLPEGRDPATTPAQPLPIIHAASTTTTRHFNVRFPSDLCFFIVWQV
jgi:hypothetical protein